MILKSNYDPELSPYRNVAGNEYRVVKQTLRDGTVRFAIQLRSCEVTDRWVTLTERSSYELAMEAVTFLTGKIIVTEEVVYDSTQPK